MFKLFSDKTFSIIHWRILMAVSQEIFFCFAFCSVGQCTESQFNAREASCSWRDEMLHQDDYLCVRLYSCGRIRLLFITFPGCWPKIMPPLLFASPTCTEHVWRDILLVKWTHSSCLRRIWWHKIYKMFHTSPLASFNRPSREMDLRGSSMSENKSFKRVPT